MIQRSNELAAACQYDLVRTRGDIDIDGFLAVPSTECRRNKPSSFHYLAPLMTSVPRRHFRRRYVGRRLMAGNFDAGIAILGHSSP